MSNRQPLKSGNVRATLKGINTSRVKRPDGTVGVYYYHRATGTRLVGAPGSPEFLASFAQAERLGRDRDKGTLAGLIRSYQGSSDYRDLAESTKQVSRWLFGVIEREYGDMTIAAIEDRKPARAEFLDWRDRMAKDKPRGADNTLAHLARVLSWAEDRGLLEVNPLEKFSRAYSGDRSDRVWLPEHIERFMEVASPPLQSAMILALHTGQRQGDLLSMPWSAFKNESALEFRQGKSKRKVYIPCTTALKKHLEELELRKKGPLILTTKKGHAWKKRNFNDRWNLVCEKAGIKGLHFHDLRGTAITMLAEAGCSEIEIATITGHSIRNISSILEKYLSRTKRLAESAIIKLEGRLVR